MFWYLRCHEQSYSNIEQILGETDSVEEEILNDDVNGKYDDVNGDNEDELGSKRQRLC